MSEWERLMSQGQVQYWRRVLDERSLSWLVVAEKRRVWRWTLYERERDTQPGHPVASRGGFEDGVAARASADAWVAVTHR